VDFRWSSQKVDASLSALSQGCICYCAIDTRGVPVLAGDLQYTIIITLLDNVLTAASITAPSNESSKIDCRLTVSQPAGGPFFVVSLTNGIDSKVETRLQGCACTACPTTNIGNPQENVSALHGIWKRDVALAQLVKINFKPLTLSTWIRTFHTSQQTMEILGYVGCDLDRLFLPS
jgi:hypothetical protein